MNELKRLLEEGCNSDPRHASQLRNAVQLYILEVEKKEAEAKRKESEFKAREEKYLAEIVTLTNKNIEKDKFLSIIAHDLRGPLGNFGAFTRLLIDGGETMSPEELQIFYVVLNESANNVFQLLENLLEWSKVGMTVNLKNVSLSQAAERAKNLHEESAKKKGINIENEIPVNLNLLCDHNMIETVLRNLIGNAVKFCSEGDNILIFAKEIDNMVEVLVCDTGIGMNTEMAEKLFHLNYDSGRPGTANEKSSGLGLKLCQKFVELHNGKIWVESLEGLGSNFYFIIPKNPAIPINSKSQVQAATD